MLKTTILASALVFAAPALAQGSQTTTTTTSPTTTTTTVDSADPGIVSRSSARTTRTTTTDAASGRTASAAKTIETDTVTDTATGATAGQTTTTTAVTSPNGDTQVSQTVTDQFATYDKDSNGNLSKAEFATWALAMKRASDPSFTASSPSGMAWIAGAFDKADADDDSAVSLVEVTRFLAPSPAN